MAFIPLFYGERGELTVTGAVYYAGRVLKPQIRFHVDTASETSLITPCCEDDLLAQNDGLRFDFYPRGIRAARTVLGDAPVKCVGQPNTGIALPDVDQAPVQTDIRFLYFSDRTRPLVPWILRPLCPLVSSYTGQRCGGVSILGRDVLNNFALLSLPARNWAFLTDDQLGLERFLSGKGGSVQPILDYFGIDGPPFPDERPRRSNRE